MEAAGMLDHKCNMDLYCLHLVFMPIISKSIKVYRRSWNLHKHRSLKHKSPNWVFEQGLLRLQAHACSTGLYFTELDQVGLLYTFASIKFHNCYICHVILSVIGNAWTNLMDNLK